MPQSAGNTGCLEYSRSRSVRLEALKLYRLLVALHELGAPDTLLHSLQPHRLMPMGDARTLWQEERVIAILFMLLTATKLCSATVGIKDNLSEISSPYCSSQIMTRSPLNFFRSEV